MILLQMFFKIAVLKNFEILSRKHLCWSPFLLKLHAWRPAFLFKKTLQHRCFAVNTVKLWRLAFLVEHLTVDYTFPKSIIIILLIILLCDGKIFGRLWVQDWHFSYFFSRCFNFLHGSWLFRTCFHSKIFCKCNFCTHYNVGSSTTLTESLKFRNNSRIAETSHSYLLWKLWIWVFWILLLYYNFSLEVVLHGAAKNSPTKKETDAKISVTLKHASSWKLAEEKM